jgi:hypothetical protein
MKLILCTYAPYRTTEDLETDGLRHCGNAGTKHEFHFFYTKINKYENSYIWFVNKL